MIATLALASALLLQDPKAQTPPQPAQAAVVKKVAILPWYMKDGVEEARNVTFDTVKKVFENLNDAVVSTAQVKATWEESMQMPSIKPTYDDTAALPEMPSAKSLLRLGEALKVDYVCAGRAKWHTKSVWVSLGPKTKADCTVDVMIVDVPNKEVLLDAKQVIADSTRKEAGLESAAAVLISMGFTAFSGGPKTPHQKRAGQMAVLLAMDPWLKTIAPKKKKIDDGKGGG